LTKCNQHKINSKLCLFWNNLKQGYDFFEQKKTLPIVTTDKQGRYLIK
jgi:murein L,D-transpeptidase YafK